MEHSASELFQELFYTHYPIVRRKLVALIRDEAAAEDLTQEVFLRLYRNPPNELDALGAWLHRVATRVGYDYLNKKTRERALLEKQDRLGDANENEAISNEQIIMDQLDQQEVQEWLNGLSERDRKALMLRYSGYSYEEIASQLEVRLPLVGTLLQRATTRLRRQADLQGHPQWSRGKMQ